MKRAVKEELSSRQKAAVILTVLGSDVSGEVLRNLGEEQIEALSLEVARLERVSPEQRENVILEFFEMAVAQDFIAEGGVEQARSVLEGAFGAERADETMKKIVNAMQVPAVRVSSQGRPFASPQLHPRRASANHRIDPLLHAGQLGRDHPEQASE